MYRIDVTAAVGSPPAVPASGTEEYFTESAPATPVPAWWLNMIQEELRNIATLKSASTNKTDLDQCKTALEMAVNAIESAALDTGTVSSEWGQAVIASSTSRAKSASNSAVLAGDGVAATGNRSSVVASVSAGAAAKIDAQGHQSFIAACTSSNAAGVMRTVGEGSAIIACESSATNYVQATGDQSFIAACSAVSGNVFADQNSAVLASKDSSNDGHYTLTAACDASGTDTRSKYAAMIASDGGSFPASHYSFVAACGGGSYTLTPATHCAIIASNDCRVKSDESAIIASNGCESTGVAGFLSFIAASTDCEIDQGNNSTVLSSSDSSAGGAYSTIISSLEGYTTSHRTLLVASGRCQLGTSYSLALGYDAGPYTPTGMGDQNLTIRLDASSGNGYFDGVADLGNADYAEYFENKKKGVLPVGSVVAFDGDKVRLSKKGDEFVRVVSAAPGIVGNSASLRWQGKFKLDEWGRPLTTDYKMVRWKGYDGRVDEAGPGEDWPEDAEQYTRTWFIKADGYDAGKEYAPRSARSDEWTVVGLLGQLNARVDDTVSAGDMIGGGKGGVGTKAAQGIRCMSIISSFDAARGYAIAKVLAV